MLMLVVIQVGIIARQQVVVVQAAREAARAASVDASPDAARQAAVASGPLESGRVTVAVSGRGAVGSTVRVSVTYRCPATVPLVGVLLHEVTLSADATMRVETASGAPRPFTPTRA